MAFDEVLLVQGNPLCQTTPRRAEIQGKIRNARTGGVIFSIIAISTFFDGLQPPVPMDPWKKVLHAYEEGNVCPQWDYLSLVYMGREDCLFLNVFTREVYDETIIL